MAEPFQFPITYVDLIEKANFLNLYNALLEQIVKDFTLANVTLDIDEGTNPEVVFNTLCEKIFRLIHTDFATYLNLLYIIDVPEDQIKKLNGGDIVELSNIITFLILKREWQKVWFKKYY